MKSLCLMLILVLSFGLQGYSQADPDVNVLMQPASMEWSQSGKLDINTCNNGNIDIVANSLRIVLSVGTNAEITGLDPSSDPRWTVLSSTTGTNNSFILKNSGGTMTNISGANPCATIKLNVKGTVTGGPSTITGTIGYISGNNPLLAGAPNSSQGNSSTANDNSTSSLIILQPSCPGNQLFTNPPANTDYFGGFESVNNFGLWINDGGTGKFIAGTGLTASQYSFVNSPNIADPLYSSFTPLGGTNQMVIKTIAANAVAWYKLDTAIKDGTGNQYYYTNGTQFPFTAYFSKVNTGTNPQIRVRVYNAENPAIVMATTDITLTETPGVWTKVQVTPNIAPPNPLNPNVSTTKKIRFDIISLNGVPFSIDQLCGASPLKGPLPIHLVDFNAVKQQSSVLLKWQTGTEINSSKFIVETSTDGINWRAIGTVAAAGNSNNQRNYSLIHSNPVNGINYYRLKQIDLDAGFVYSEIRSVSFLTVNPTDIKVLPNPTSDRLYISGGSAVIFETVTIYSAEGKLIQQTRNLPSGGSIDLSEFAAGVYMVKITDANGKTDVKSVVKK